MSNLDSTQKKDSSNENVAEGNISEQGNYASEEASQNVKIWDLPTRLFHWLLVIGIAAAYITNSLGVTYFKYHAWCGYAVIVLVVFRIVWGFVGTYHARFSNFIRSPIATFKYSVSYFRRHSSHYAGHNPLGAIMVVIFLITLFVQATTGLFSNDEIFNVGPLYNYVSAELSLQLTSLHRQLFYWIMGAVVLHVIAVLVHVFFKRENIIKSMITGKKPRTFYSEVKAITSSRMWLAVMIITVVSAGLAWIIFQAPAPIMDMSYE